MAQKTTYISLSTLTAEQKALITDEQMATLKGLETALVNVAGADKLMDSAIKSAIKATENEAKLALKEAEKAEKKAQRQADKDAKHAEKYISFTTSCKELDIESERNDLKGMVIVNSKKFGTEVVIPSGHDANSIVILRQTNPEGAYEMVFDTKQKRCARTANLVHNNKTMVAGWIKDAVSRFNNIFELAEFLKKQVNSKGEAKYNVLDLDLLNEMQNKGDKTAARLAKKYGSYYTVKSIR